MRPTICGRQPTDLPATRAAGSAYRARHRWSTKEPLTMPFNIGPMEVLFLLVLLLVIGLIVRAVVR